MLSFMRPFGYPFTILNTINHLGKFDGKVDEGYFIGYSLNSKAFRVSRTRIVKETLNIRFSENTPNNLGSGPNWLFDIDALTKIMNYQPVVAGTQTNGNAGTQTNGNAVVAEVNAVGRKSSIELPDDPNMPELEDISIFKDSKEDVFCANADLNNLQSTFQTWGMLKNLEAHGLVSNIIQRKTIKTFKIVYLPAFYHKWNPKRSISSKWVYRNKLDERGIVIRNKARLMAQGHTEEEGIDYDEVFAPVARIEATRLFLAYASFKDFVVYQMDVKSTFLYEKIEEKVYVCQPPGFEDPDYPDKVYKVEKSLYGFHKAIRAWYETLSTYLLENRFQKGKTNKTLFIRRHKGDILLVQVYVDDIIFGLIKKELCTSFEKLMHDNFQMSSTGEHTFFLGLQTAQQTKIDGLERRVKKLEKKHMSRTHKIKRLYKVGLTTKVISSFNGGALDKEDTSKHRKIDEIDANEDIALVNTHDVVTHDDEFKDEVIEDVGEEEVVKVVTTAKILIDTIIDVAQVTTAIADIPVSAAKTIVTTAPTITDESTKTNVKVTQAPKRKGVMIQELEEKTTTKTASLQQP
nr:putative ribonuclease H-like domain-containing protein [Tanacetum cinerariifolium]